jgi:hypothetical protein
VSRGTPKLAQLLFTRELPHQLVQTSSPAIAVSAHPGVARTDPVPGSAGPLRVIERRFGWMFSDPEGAALSLEYAATEPVDGGAYVGPDGLARLRGNPSVHQSATEALDAATARRLWQLSAELTGTAVRA